MRVLVDAVGVRAGSGAVILEHLLAAWAAAYDDELVVLADGEPAFPLPPGVATRRVTGTGRGAAGALWARTWGVRGAARGVDAVVSGVVASALAGTTAPRGAIVCDVRHELRPHQFGRGRRLARRLSYGWTFRAADALFCISARTRDDLVRRRPWLADRAVVAHCGADHVDRWPPPGGAEDPGRYALAFGQFENKNVDAVLAAWQVFCRRDDGLVLRLVGTGGRDRARLTGRVTELGLDDRVELMPWLDDDAFARCFAGASLVVFPSDFEGFGLPAVEALRLQVPVVVSQDPALAEVTGGHATVAADVAPEPLAAALEEALRRTPEQLAAGRRHTEAFRWAGMAASIREALVRAGAGERRR